mmetsp:Transcript_9969/g.15056  ORF Transcript_9969/g.15056 Transcript_9969/m.15056 type:complete len:95 (-) Transcript_9969:742-1026(-)
MDGAKKQVDKQVIMATATVSKQMEDLCYRFWDPADPQFDIFIEKSTHMNLSNLKHEFIHLSDFDKTKPLQLLVREYRKYASKHKTSAVVFCNSI